MKFKVLVLVVLLKIIHVENVMMRMMPLFPATMTSILNDDTTLSGSPSANYLHENGEDEERRSYKRVPQKSYDYNDEYNYEAEKKQPTTTKKPCAIVVLSNLQNPNVQSLLRKYRYDGNGILIPSSVKYYIKLPHGARDAPVLVPLNDKAFSPLGGFVRYYKEVPPIPRAWKR